MVEKRRLFAKNFFNDEDGFTKDDLEKLIFLTLTIASVVVSLVVYCITGDITPNMVYLVSAIMTATVARKGLSYLKPDRYYGRNVSTEQLKANNPQQYSGYSNYDPYMSSQYSNPDYYNNGYAQELSQTDVPTGSEPQG
jgi:hypothetical protein